MRTFALFLLFVLGAIAPPVETKESPTPIHRELHVSMSGNDSWDGAVDRPLRTIGAAARLAQAGDVVTVHEGVYRETVNPPRGGTSDAERIVYCAAPGEKVEIKGSEIVTGWSKAEGDVWTIEIPNSLFGDYNPYREQIRGDWFDPKGRTHHTGAVYLNGEWLMEASSLDALRASPETDPRWFGEAGEENTRLWAAFPGVDPNHETVEINVRRAVFYPDKPGRNYITVRGFILRHAAAPWAPPTAEQVGLLGVHWSKGWIIEGNIVSHSKCAGITLGKYGDEWDNTSEDTAEGYVKTIERALAYGWNRENIGGHIVRDNTISHCEQAGIVGSLGAAFSLITRNTIHDIHQQKLFTGAEMAGVKVHAAIDAEISHNRIFRTVRGVWLDWMAQGARVSANLLHNNDSEDLFMEVNHGPFLVDNNIFLSNRSLLDMSEGGAYVHNLMAGRLLPRPELSRETPYHKAHSTEVAGLRNIVGGDNRFYNNIFCGGGGLSEYDDTALPVSLSGNVFLQGAAPSRHEPDPYAPEDDGPPVELIEEGANARLRIALDDAWASARKRRLVDSEWLGRAMTPDLPFVHPDDSPIRVDCDYFGRKRNESNPFPGPFEWSEGGTTHLTVWPRSETRGDP